MVKQNAAPAPIELQPGDGRAAVLRSGRRPVQPCQQGGGVVPRGGVKGPEASVPVLLQHSGGIQRVSRLAWQSWGWSAAMRAVPSGPSRPSRGARCGPWLTACCRRSRNRWRMRRRRRQGRIERKPCNSTPKTGTDDWGRCGSHLYSFGRNRSIHVIIVRLCRQYHLLAAHAMPMLADKRW